MERPTPGNTPEVLVDEIRITDGVTCEKWYAKGEQVRTIDGMIDWLRELWKLHEVFATDPVMAKLLAA